MADAYVRYNIDSQFSTSRTAKTALGAHDKEISALLQPVCESVPDEPKEWLAAERLRVEASLREAREASLRRERTTARLEALAAESAVAGELGRLG